jgi:hypothetical protein
MLQDDGNDFKRPEDRLKHKNRFDSMYLRKLQESLLVSKALLSINEAIRLLSSYTNKTKLPTKLSVESGFVL